jgi:hypothetical protein
MAKLGVPTAKDVDALIQRVDDLAKAVARLASGAGVAPKSAKPAAAAQSAAKAVKRTAPKAAVTKPAAKAAGTKTVKASSRSTSRAARKAPATQ